MGDAHPVGKGHFHRKIGNQVMAVAPCDPTLPFLLQCHSSAGNANAIGVTGIPVPGGDKPRLTISTDTFLMMQDSFSPVSPKTPEPRWLLRWSQVAQGPEPHLIHVSDGCAAASVGSAQVHQDPAQPPGAPCWDISIPVLFY